jgi:copper chaperone NosL
MGMFMRMVKSIFFLFLFFFVVPVNSQGESDAIGPDTRCAVCGMFVAKYPQWLVSLTLDDGKTIYFDGVKDLMAYYLSPSEFGGSSQDGINKVTVKDYYSQKWSDGKAAWFVAGSDVLGPMGHELLPFASKEAAVNFMKDHHGTEILPFNAITAERITSMRKGHKMKMMMKN